MGTGGALQEPDPQVIGAARAGDAAAFADLVRHCQGDVWRLVFHLVRNETLADDVTQDAFIRAYRFLATYRADAKFSTWLYSIARNCAMDELRRGSRRRKVMESLEVVPPPSQPDHAVVLEVREAIANLPPDLREPVILVDLLGTSYRDAAAILGTAEGTVKSRLHRARETLAEMLTPREGRTIGEV
jgi:RNA polymerase sigma-70 factor (ECF subfamily)